MAGEGKTREIYDDIVFDYGAIKSCIYKAKYEEPAFWEALGEISGKNILDLACGSGFYTRSMKLKGANTVVGVDISDPMILEAKRQEEQSTLDIQYYVGDAKAYSYKSDACFDVVTAQYLLCYAESKEALKQFCQTAYKNTKSGGGRFLTLNTVLDETKSQLDLSLGYQIILEHTNAQDDGTAPDGVRAQIILFSADMKSKCSLPIYMWSFSTIKDVLSEVGFKDIEELTPLQSVPCVIISANRY